MDEVLSEAGVVSEYVTPSKKIQFTLLTICKNWWKALNFFIITLSFALQLMRKANKEIQIERRKGKKENVDTLIILGIPYRTFNLLQQ
jgi:hypothetical protein